MLALALLAATPAAAPPAYPAKQVVAAFAQACRETPDFARARTALLAAGWEAYTPAPDSIMGKLLAKGRAAIASDPDGATMIDGGTFRRTVAGEQLELTLSGVKMGDIVSLGCRVFDFGEARAIPVAAVTALVGRAPGQTIATPQLSKSLWEPGYAEGLRNTELYFVPADSPAVAMLGAPGLVLVAQHMKIGR